LNQVTEETWILHLLSLISAPIHAAVGSLARGCSG
jgi:hypothetical protein